MSGSTAIAGNIVFGCAKTSDVPDDHVEDLWANNQDSEYIKVKKAVLQKQNKAHQPKKIVTDPSFSHGVKTKASDEAKHLIYAKSEVSGESKDDPGVQARRDYKWPDGVEPDTNIFGVKGFDSAGQRSSSAGVANALCMKSDSVGGNKKAPKQEHGPDQVFGMPTSSKDCSAGECLIHPRADGDSKGDDIGKSLTPGFRNASTVRAFGCPSVRTDIAKYERSSVADTQSYGDDVNAGYLLRPSLLSSFGLDEDEFLKPRSKSYLKKLFVQRCELNLDDATFDEIFSEASSDNNLASIDSFRKRLRMQ